MRFFLPFSRKVHQNIMRQFYFLILESTLKYLYNFAEGVSKRNISRKMASYYCFRYLPFKVQKPKGRVSLPFCAFNTHIRLPIFFISWCIFRWNNLFGLILLYTQQHQHRENLIANILHIYIRTSDFIHTIKCETRNFTLVKTEKISASVIS